MPLRTKKDLPDMAAIGRNWAKHKGTSLRSISRKLKKNPDFLRQSLSTRDARPSVLLALSDFLGVNLFEYYLELLPPHIRPTSREKELEKQLEALRNELKRVEQERDRYWRVIENR